MSTKNPHTHCDVIIIGAGVAGLVAAKTLGNRCIVLEALSTIGGRTRTIQVSPDIPWDEGAHWIHDPDSQHHIRQQLPPQLPPMSYGPHLLIDKDKKQDANDTFPRATCDPPKAKNH